MEKLGIIKYGECHWHFFKCDWQGNPLEAQTCILSDMGMDECLGNEMIADKIVEVESTDDFIEQVIDKSIREQEEGHLPLKVKYLLPSGYKYL